MRQTLCCFGREEMTIFGTCPFPALLMAAEGGGTFEHMGLCWRGDSRGNSKLCRNGGRIFFVIFFFLIFKKTSNGCR